MSVIFVNDGGPLVVLPGDVAAAWRGADDPDARPGADDYARACAAGYPASLLAVGSSVGIVIGAQDQISTAAWHDRLPVGLYLIGSIVGDEDEDADLTETLSAQSARAWEPLGLMRSSDGRLLLLHAAWAGDEAGAPRRTDYAVIGDIVDVTVGTGMFAVHAIELTTPGGGVYNVVRWTPALSRLATG